MQRHSYLTLRAESGAAAESTMTTEGRCLADSDSSAGGFTSMHSISL